MNQIPVLSKWLHTNGEIYTVFGVANKSILDGDRDEFPLMIVYFDAGHNIYCKHPTLFLKNRTRVTDKFEDELEPKPLKKVLAAEQPPEIQKEIDNRWREAYARFLKPNNGN